MKTQLSFWAMCLLMVGTLSGQIKIGDNPQNIDPASVLELESTSRVLVITRVTDAQMSSITPLRGALVYNTDQDCLHYYDGNEWINICEAFNDAFTVSTNAVFNPFANDSTVVVTQTDTNYNFEVNQITGDNIVDTSINGANEIQQGSITGLQLSDATITFDKLADGENTGDLLRWNGNEWVLVDETAITVTELDGVVGNEVTGPADTTLELSGAGDELSPYLLDVSVGGIGTNELDTDAVTTDKIAAGAVESADIAAGAVNAATINNDVAGTGLTQNLGTGALEVDVTSLTGDGSITSSDLTVTGGANATLNNVALEIAAGAVGNNELDTDAVTTDKIAAGAVESADIAAGAVNAATINNDVAGTGLTQNLGTGALEVDVTSLTGDGSITSSDLTVTGGANATLNNVALEIAAGAVGNNELDTDAVTTDKIAAGAVESADIAAGAVNAATINNDVAGTGLTQNLGTGALEVDVTSLTGDGSITSSDLTVTGGANATLNNVALEIAAGAVGNNELDTDAVTTDKIAAGAVESADIAAGAVNAATINNDVAGTGLTQNLGTGALEVDVTSLTGDGSITSSDLTVTGGANATLNNVALEIAAGAVGNNELDTDAVTTDKIAAGAVESADIAAGAVNAATINNDVAGTGLTQNLGTGALEVDVTSLTGDGSITSSDLTVTGGANATLNNVALEIAAGVITNADISATAAIDGSKINPVFVADVTTTGDFIDLTPDFVFEKYYNGFSDLNNDYIFKSLEEVESFLKKHHHLPGIRSAYDIKASGVYRLTESSLGQLEKIEELFLHTIEQEKKIEKLATENEKLSNELNLLKVEMENIKAMLLQKAQE